VACGQKIALGRRILNYARSNLRQQVRFITWNEVIRKTPKRPIRELSLAEEAQLEVLERPEVMVLRRFKFASGLRIAPIINLTWPQIDFINETVTLIEKGKKPVTKPMDSEMRAILWELWTPAASRNPRVLICRVAHQDRAQKNPLTVSVKIESRDPETRRRAAVRNEWKGTDLAEATARSTTTVAQAARRSYR
jgi:integrase